MVMSEDHFVEMETNVLPTTVPRAMEENTDHSYLAATWWEAIVGLASPRGFVKKLKTISWESSEHVDTRIKVKLQHDIELNPGPSLAEERKRQRVCRKRKGQKKIVGATKERVGKMKGKIKLMAWNVQKANIDFPRGCRFVEILKYIFKERIEFIRNVRTDNEFSLSDHKPKTMKIASKSSKMENQQSRKQGKRIDWEKLDCDEVRMNQHDMNRKLSSREKSGN